MNPVEKDVLSRKNEIIAEVRGIFKVNMKLVDWDVPEADDRMAAKAILDVMQEALDTLRKETEEGKYNDY